MQALSSEIEEEWCKLPARLAAAASYLNHSSISNACRSAAAGSHGRAVPLGNGICQMQSSNGSIEYMDEAGLQVRGREWQ